MAYAALEEVNDAGISVLVAGMPEPPFPPFPPLPPFPPFSEPDPEPVEPPSGAVMAVFGLAPQSPVPTRTVTTVSASVVVAEEIMHRAKAKAGDLILAAWKK